MSEEHVLRRLLVLAPIVLLAACNATVGAKARSPSDSPPSKSPADGMDLVSIKGGVVRMGSPEREPERDTDEGPLMEVSISDFRIDRTPVTTEAFEARAGAIRAADPSGQWWQEDQTPAGWLGKCNLGSTRRTHPANCVNWSAARAYCRLVGGDLPTEAEFEYAARAGARTAFWWGDSFDPARAISSVSCSARGCRGATEPVVHAGSRCNSWGICDMAGNVWQWTLTDYRDHLGESVVVVPIERPSDPVHRGGSWLNHVSSLFRSAHRGRNYPSHGLTGVGFRCVRR